MHRGRDAKGGEAGDAILRQAAGNDPAEMGQVRFDVQRDAVPAHPARDADADRADLCFGAGGGIGDPDADAALAALALDVETVERADQPFFQTIDITAYVSGRDAAVPAIE